MDINDLTGEIIGCCIEIHRELGPGMLESAYEECLAYELTKAGLLFERQKPIPIRYKEIDIEYGYRMDFVVENLVVVELKSVEAIKFYPYCSNFNLHEICKERCRTSNQFQCIITQKRY